MRPLLFAVASLALACVPSPIDLGDAGPGDAGAADADVVAASGYCEAIVDFFCPYYVRCGRMAVATVDECRGVFLAECHARFEPSYVSLESAGLLSLSRAGLDACAAHLDDVSCAQQLFDLDGPCATMWQGRQPAGARCGFDIESFVCAPGTACVLDVGLCGTCRTIVDDGGGCNEETLTCAVASTCEDGECVARSRVGEPCPAGERCVLGAVCDDGVCAGPRYVGVGDACDNFEGRCPFRAECRAGQCRLAVAIGDACDATTPCDASGSCSGGVCVELVAQGGACEEADACQTGVCAEGHCSVIPGACFP
jgi:hypothetical protein